MTAAKSSTALSDFLNRSGYRVTTPIQGDASLRAYSRVEKGGQKALLMDYSADPAGTKRLGDFIRIGAWLGEIGLKVPAVYECDSQNALAIIEDIGTQSFLEKKDYGLASEVLVRLASEKCPLDLPRYYGDNHLQIHKAKRRVIDWYMPAAKLAKNPQGLAEEYESVWQGIENGLPSCAEGFLHLDYHAQNLIWCEAEQGIRRCGIIDFQDAMIGPRPYDLACLLEDARVDVDAAIRDEILSRHDESFRLWYRVLATQFHCRVIGQFIKLDITRPGANYRRFIPRVEGYMRDALTHPVLVPLAKFFARQGLDFNTEGALNMHLVKSFIHEDAF